MARQKGILRLSGTLDGLNFYHSRHGDLVRVSGGGFNSTSARTYPRIKENNDEMGMASKVNAAFKRCFRDLLIGYKDGTLHQRLQSLFMNLKDLDTLSVRGQRTVSIGIATDYGKRLLKDFKFTPKRPVLLPGRLDFDWATQTLTVSQFDMQAVAMQEGADLMGLELLTVNFDFETLDYVSERSTLLELDGDFADSHFSLSTTVLPDGPGIRFAVLRVAFYQQVNGVNYFLKGGEGFGLGIVSIL